MAKKNTGLETALEKFRKHPLYEQTMGRYGKKKDDRIV